ncbi:hypothetical protein IC006_0645 [Sulfuracidifex tepidarius]|uniref:Uncharacterized protein n=1 Tax=Sulfuracidifex tepidarius TaxID=1294262 RepID=A0A510DT70_9CREN|nr:hypothetical protein [Sulfuracidifex tepidarius]BBG23361.1 hypothetical protein IC006_0645 [Sulfuracidifex tepidarius]
MDLKKAFIPVFMSLFLISLATPFLASAALPAKPIPYPGPKGPSWCYIPNKETPAVVYPLN